MVCIKDVTDALEFNKDVLYDNIKMLCKENGITIAQLEIKAGLTRGSINKWLSTFPSWDKLIKVAECFDVSIDFLLGRTNDRQSHKPLNPYEMNLIERLRVFKLNNAIVDLLVEIVTRIQNLA